MDLFEYLHDKFVQSSPVAATPEAFVAFARAYLQTDPVVSVAYDKTGMLLLLQAGACLPIVQAPQVEADGPVVPITTAQRPMFQPAVTPVNAGSEQAITGRPPG